MEKRERLIGIWASSVVRQRSRGLGVGGRDGSLINGLKVVLYKEVERFTCHFDLIGTMVLLSFDGRNAVLKDCFIRLNRQTL